jgi:hypothetical protein
MARDDLSLVSVFTRPSAVVGDFGYRRAERKTDLCVLPSLRYPQSGFRNRKLLSALLTKR